MESEHSVITGFFLKLILPMPYLPRSSAFHMTWNHKKCQNNNVPLGQCKTSTVFGLETEHIITKISSTSLHYTRSSGIGGADR